jgi:heat shock protein HspQ
VNTVFAMFSVGEIVHHKLFDYRGVIIDVDPEYRGTDEWYEKVALSRPPKNRPWYHVLRDGTDNQTYVAERNLEADGSDDPIHHPDLDDYFFGQADGIYVPRRQGN